MTIIVCTLLVVVAAHRWLLYKMDVTNASLHGRSFKVVYLIPPPGYGAPTTHVCRRQRTIYGLKYAYWAWFECFCLVVLQASFLGNPHDRSLFVRCTRCGRVVLLLYVNDMVISGDDTRGIQYVKHHLQLHIQMKNLGLLRFFGAWRLLSSNGIFLSQQKPCCLWLMIKLSIHLFNRMSSFDSQMVSYFLSP